MTLDEIKQFISEQGWTPQEKTRQRGTLYLSAARKAQGKTIWRYIGAVSKLHTLTEQEILAKLNK